MSTFNQKYFSEPNQIHRLSIWDVSKKIFVVGIILAISLAALTRFPALSQDQPPYMFCDEEWFFYGDVINMLNADGVSSGSLTSGPMNVYPVWILVRIIELFTPLSDNQVLLLGRIVLPFGLGVLAVVPLAMFIRYFSGLRYLGLAGVAFYAVSPFLSAVSRYWYPDHYIFFFSTLVLMFSARLITVEKPFWTSVLLGISSAMVFSVKYTAAVLAIFVFLAYRERRKRLTSSSPGLVEEKSTFSTLSISFIFFTLLFHLNSIVHFDKLIQQQVYNLENYSRIEANPIEGIFAYSFVIFLISLGPLGLMLFVAAIYRFARARQLKRLMLWLSPVFALIIALGSQGLFSPRNVIPVTPIVFAVFALGVHAIVTKVRSKPGFSSALLVTLLGVLTVLQVTLAGYAFAQDLRPDSRKIAQNWIREMTPREAVFGTNEFCFGLSPAKVAGRATIVDPQMSEQLEYYVFDSYEISAISDYFRGGRPSRALFEPKYLHFYYYGDRGIYTSILSLFEPINPPSIEGYTLVKRFVENGPEVWVFKKSR